VSHIASKRKETYKFSKQKLKERNDFGDSGVDGGSYENVPLSRLGGVMASVGS
jgi:hypothetical protein